MSVAPHCRLPADLRTVTAARLTSFIVRRYNRCRRGCGTASMVCHSGYTARHRPHRNGHRDDDRSAHLVVNGLRGIAYEQPHDAPPGGSTRWRASTVHAGAIMNERQLIVGHATARTMRDRPTTSYQS
jgi:hypothetical protein